MTMQIILTTCGMRGMYVINLKENYEYAADVDA